MKKLKLRLSQIEGSELLTREQLKNVLGGSAEVTTTSNCIADGQACGLIKQCCNECLATFKCGKSTP